MWLERVQVRPSTLRGYRSTVSQHLLPRFGNVLLEYITVEDIDLLRVQLLKKLAPRTVNKTLTVLSSMLKQAVIWKYLVENPATYVQRAKEEHAEMDFFTPEEVRRLLDACDDDLRPIILTAVMTGLREGELFGLKWGDFDSVAGVLKVQRSYDAREGYQAPKSKAGRRAVSLAPEVVTTLQSRREDARLPVFNDEGQPLNALSVIRCGFEPALKRAGLRRIRFHDLRHTYVALMLAAGENIKFIQHQVGHSSIRTTLDRYGHLIPQVSAGTGQRLSALVFGENVVSQRHLSDTAEQA
jgi:integrase